MRSLRQEFEQKNRNNVLLQNWRNDRITYYSKRGYSPRVVADFIDNKLLNNSVRLKYIPYYSSKIQNIPSVSKDNLLSSLNVKLSVNFPSIRRIK